jgi:hypothetical protein
MLYPISAAKDELSRRSNVVCKKEKDRKEYIILSCPK